MTSTSTTICARATPLGVSGLAVIRLSGVGSFDIITRCVSQRTGTKIQQSQSHTIIYGSVRSSTNDIIDTVTFSIYRSPNSYTGEDCIEIGCHGGSYVVHSILRRLYECGAVAATAGEFTKRAFLNGKLDLLQVESVADIIHSQSYTGSHVSARQLQGHFTKHIQDARRAILDIVALLELELDFAHEDVEFTNRSSIFTLLTDVKTYTQNLLDSFKGSEILRNGFSVGLIGFPNAGKSSLFNALLAKERSIVSDIAGTTRDYIEDYSVFDSITLRFFDTAGIRESTDSIEIEGIKLSYSLLAECHIVIVVNDVSQGIDNSISLLSSIAEITPGSQILLVHHKSDLIPQDSINILHSSVQQYYTTCFDSDSIDTLRKAVVEFAQASTSGITDSLINDRHFALLLQLSSHIDSAFSSLSAGMSNEIPIIDLREAIRCLGVISGDVWDDDVLTSIFSRFCIGK